PWHQPRLLTYHTSLSPTHTHSLLPYTRSYSPPSPFPSPEAEEERGVSHLHIYLHLHLHIHLFSVHLSLPLSPLLSLCLLRGNSIQAGPEKDPKGKSIGP